MSNVTQDRKIRHLKFFLPAESMDPPSQGLPHRVAPMMQHHSTIYMNYHYHFYFICKF